MIVYVDPLHDKGGILRIMQAGRAERIKLPWWTQSGIYNRKDLGAPFKSRAAWPYTGYQAIRFRLHRRSGATHILSMLLLLGALGGNHFASAPASSGQLLAKGRVQSPDCAAPPHSRSEGSLRLSRGSAWSMYLCRNVGPKIGVVTKAEGITW